MGRHTVEALFAVRREAYLEDGVDKFLRNVGSY
jgi:hypothetical protein